MKGAKKATEWMIIVFNDLIKELEDFSLESG